MKASTVLLNAAKKSNRPPVPVEMYPLFAATAVAVASGCYFTYRHFAYDKQLRLWGNPNLSDLDRVLAKDAANEEKN